MPATFDPTQYDIGKNPLDPSNTGRGVGVGLDRLKQLQQALTSGQIDLPTYNKLFQQFDPTAFQQINQYAAGGEANARSAQGQGLQQFNDLSKLGGTDLTQFQGIFKNLTGRDPNAQDMQKYFENVGQTIASSPGGTAGTNYNDLQNLLTAYVQNTYGPDVQKFQVQNTEDLVQSAVDKQTQDTLKYLTNPATMNQIETAYNQKGLLNSGAFSQGIGNTLAQGATTADINALTGTVLPTIMNMNPLRLDPGLTDYGNKESGIYNFQQQRDLANKYASEIQPSSFQQWAPVIQGALQGGGAAAGGYMMSPYETSAICMELMRRGLVSRKEFDALHWKIIPSMFTRCRALYFYARNGHKLVKAANEQGFNWQEAKSWFIDEPLSQETSIQAVHIYSLACKKLAMVVAPECWDERVLKSSVWDFLRYIIPVLMVRDYRECYKNLFLRHFVIRKQEA